MEEFLATILMVGFNFNPVGYAFCNGQLLPINQNTALFSLLGTQYGGDGIQNFALPNLQGRFPIHQGTGFTIGQQGGAQTNTLFANQLPAHSHPFNVNSSLGNTAAPGTTTYLSKGPSTGSGPNAVVEKIYTTAAANTTLNPGTVGNNTGGGQPFSIMPPYLCINFIIALTGIFPSRN